MTTIEPAQKLDHTRRVVDARLEAAWLQKCGPQGTPGKWWIPGELMEILDSELEVEVYPTYAHVDNDGKPTSWSSSFYPDQPGVVDAWDWRLGAGWDDCTTAETDHLEDLGACMDDRSMSFLILGSHDTKPPVPDEVIEAIVFLESTDR